MASKRMSPAAQSNARKDLDESLRDTATGDPDVDAIMRSEVRRKLTFAGPGRITPKPSPVVAGSSSTAKKPGLIASIGNFFKKKRK